MICGVEKYRYYASVDSGANYIEVDLNNFPKLADKKESNEIFYRRTSDDWELQRFKNIPIYDTILGFMQNPCSTVLEIRFQIRTEAETLWTGALRVNNVNIDEGLGILNIKPVTIDAYDWWDKDKDTVITPSLNFNTVQYVTQSTPFSFQVQTTSPTGAPPDYGGMEICTIDTGPPRIITYIQQRIPFAAAGYTQGNGVFDQFSGSQPYPELPPDPSATNCPTNLYFKASCTQEVISTETLGNNFMRYDDIVNSILSQLGTGLTLESTFLNDATNPITGSANSLNDILIGLVSEVDAVDIDGKNIEFTFDILMNIIKNLNCFWFVEDDKLKIEHIKTINDARVGGIDLTESKYNTDQYLTLQDIEGNRTDNIYNFKIEIPIKEEFEYPEGDNRIGTIEYTNGLADDKKTKKHESRGIIADVIKLINFPDSLDEDNYILLVTDFVSSFLYEIREEEGLLNWHLSWDKILNNYWIYNRPFTTGLINGVSKTFTTIEKNKIQTDIEFPDLDDIYDPDKYIITNMGPGEAEAFSLDTENGFIKVTLKQDACL